MIWGVEINHDYRKLMKSIAKKILLVQGDLDALIDGLGYVGWCGFQEADHDSKKDIPILIHDLLSNIMYCSDQWSWDRFLRVNWIYNRIKRRLFEEESE